MPVIACSRKWKVSCQSFHPLILNLLPAWISCWLPVYLGKYVRVWSIKSDWGPFKHDCVPKHDQDEPLLKGVAVWLCGVQHWRKVLNDAWNSGWRDALIIITVVTESGRRASIDQTKVGGTPAYHHLHQHGWERGVSVFWHTPESDQASLRNERTRSKSKWTGPQETAETCDYNCVTFLIIVIIIIYDQVCSRWQNDKTIFWESLMYIFICDDDASVRRRRVWPIMTASLPGQLSSTHSSWTLHIVSINIIRESLEMAW